MTYIKGGILSAKQLNKLSASGGSGGGSLPDVTESDNDCVLTVIEGEWTPYPPLVSKSTNFDIGTLIKIGSLVYFHFSGIVSDVVGKTIPNGFRPANQTKIIADVGTDNNTVTMHKLIVRSNGDIRDYASPQLESTEHIEISAVWASF